MSLTLKKNFIFIFFLIVFNQNFLSLKYTIKNLEEIAYSLVADGCASFNGGSTGGKGEILLLFPIMMI